MMNHGDDLMFSGGGFMWLFWLVILLVVVVLVGGIFRSRTGVSKLGNDSPVDILKRRLASGEIDHEEYSRLHKELMK